MSDATDPGEKPKKAPRNAREAVVEALATFEGELDGRIAELLDLRRLDGRDSALAREIALGVVRRQRLIDYLLSMWATRGLPRSPRTRAAMRAGLYQLLFLDRIPAHAAVDSAVKASSQRFRGLVNAVLRGVDRAVVESPASDPLLHLPLGEARHLVLPEPLPEDPVQRAALLGGLPDFLVVRWAEAYGIDRAAELAAASCRTPSIHLRPVRIDRDALVARLAETGVETEPADNPRLLRWSGGYTPFGNPAFVEGAFAVQDPTALAAAEAVAAEPGERILDLCAAPGTKAAVLAEAVGENGVVMAYDKDRDRLERVRENAERLRLSNLKICLRPDDEEAFDAVLVDVPCSNTGVLARRVEVRHRLEPELFEELPTLQRRLLAWACELVGPGGRVIYSTCSIESEENEGVVNAVLSELGRGELVESRLSLPEPPDHDGGYFAVIRF